MTLIPASTFTGYLRNFTNTPDTAPKINVPLNRKMHATLENSPFFDKSFDMDKRTLELNTIQADRSNTRDIQLVLHVVEAFEGGVLNSIANICQSLKGDFKFVILHGERSRTPPDYQRLFPEETQTIKWNVSQTRSLRANMRSMRELVDVVSQFKIPCIHAHSSTAGAIARLAFPFAPPRIIYSPRCFAFLRRDIGVAKKLFFRSVEWILGRHSATVVGCSTREYYEAKKVSRHNACIFNSIDINAVDQGAPRCRPFNKKVVVTAVGRILPQKNFGQFLEVARRMESDKEIHFVWVGGGADSHHKLENICNVTIMDWLNHKEVLQTLAGSDIFIHTAEWEGLSRACLEAGASGLPLLLSCCDGSDDLVPSNGSTGWICGDVDEFVINIRNLSRCPNLRAEVGERARALIYKTFNSKKINCGWGSLYRGLPLPMINESV